LICDLFFLVFNTVLQKLDTSRLTYCRFLELLECADFVIKLSVYVSDADVHFGQVGPLCEVWQAIITNSLITALVQYCDGMLVVSEGFLDVVAHELRACDIDDDFTCVPLLKIVVLEPLFYA